MTWLGSLTRLALFGAVLLAHAAEAGEIWNRFRGPNGSGVASSEANPPLKIGPDALAWKTPAAKGLSSPIVQGGKVFLTAFENQELATFCFDARTGRVLWRREAPKTTIEKVHEFNSPATPTPCADEQRVFVYFGSYGLLCYDLNGRLIWQKAMPTPQNLYGTAASPILYQDLLIMVLDSDANLPGSKLSQSKILAVKKATGETAWESPRPLQRSGWSTPAVWYKPGGDDLVVLGSGRLCGYNPQTGDENWFVTGFARETTVVPVFAQGLVFASSAMGGIADEKPDLDPLWNAMLYFDANKDGKIAQSEMTEYFTFPLRPEVPPTHPGFGVPVPSDPAKRAERQRGIFASIDKNRDGFWTREEFLANLGPRPFKPWLAAVRPGGSGDVTESHIAWHLRRAVPELPSPIAYEDRLYMVRNGGILTAVDAASGKIIFDERLEAPGQYSASPVIARGCIYLLSNKGVISVVKAGDRFERVHQHDLGERVFVTPAIDGGALFVRTETNLLAFRTLSPGGGARAE